MGQLLKHPNYTVRVMLEAYAVYSSWSYKEAQLKRLGAPHCLQYLCLDAGICSQTPAPEI